MEQMDALAAWLQLRAQVVDELHSRGATDAHIASILSIMDPGVVSQIRTRDRAGERRLPEDRLTTLIALVGIDMAIFNHEVDVDHLKHVPPADLPLAAAIVLEVEEALHKASPGPGDLYDRPRQSVAREATVRILQLLLDERYDARSKLRSIETLLPR